MDLSEVTFAAGETSEDRIVVETEDSVVEAVEVSAVVAAAPQEMEGTVVNTAAHRRDRETGAALIKLVATTTLRKKSLHQAGPCQASRF